MQRPALPRSTMNLSGAGLPWDCYRVGQEGAVSKPCGLWEAFHVLGFQKRH